LAGEVAQLRAKIKTLKLQRKKATRRSSRRLLNHRIHKLKKRLRYLLDRYHREFYRRWGRHRRRHKHVYRHLSRGVVVPGEFRPSRGSVIAKHNDLRTKRWRGAITYTFWVKPLGTQANWANLFHKGSVNVARHPAVWFFPGSTRLLVRSGTRTPRTASDWNGYTNFGCNPAQSLTLGKWHFVAFTHRKGSMKVYLGGRKGRLRRRCEVRGAPAPVPNFGSLRSSDPWYPPANAVMADLRVYNRALGRRSLRAIQRKRMSKRHRHHHRHHKA